MALRAQETEVVRDALAPRCGESFEVSLGRAVRRHDGDYADYIAIVAHIRDLAKEGKTDLWSAARTLVRQE